MKGKKTGRAGKEEKMSKVERERKGNNLIVNKSKKEKKNEIRRNTRKPPYKSDVLCR